MIPPLCISVFNIIMGNFDTSNWALPFTVGFPISTETVWGWYLEWLAQLSMTLGYNICIITTTSYFICCCFYLYAMCDQFNFHMCTIQQEIERGLDEKAPEKYHDRYIKIKENMYKAIGIQAKAYK